MGKWIDKIGIEVEIEVDPVGINETPVVDGFERENDGSIHPRDGGKAVEYVSEPVEFDHTGMPNLEAGITEIYERHNGRANETMGLHIHVSFTSDFYYYALASMRFYRYFMDHIRNSDLWDRNARLRRRARGVDYAQPIESHTALDSSLKTPPAGADRYRHFIYRPRQDTIEFRIFPAMNSPEDVFAAIDLTTTAINSYLAEKRYKMDEEQVVDVQTTNVTEGNEQELDKVVQYV